MSGVQKITIPDHDAGGRLDRWFKRQFPHIPHGKVEKLLRKGEIRLDGKRAKGNVRIEGGQIVRVPPLPDPSDMAGPPPVPDADAEFIRSLVVYEDDEIIALNKPAGIAVQGGTKTTRHIDGMLPALGEGCRLVHRLDRDTSGILLIAKTAAAAKWAGRAFQSRRAEKIYWGITNGVPRPVSGEIKGYMAKGMPLTGRTHQLRLHMQLLGAPIAGDPRYFTDRPKPGGLANMLHLHARSLELPRDGREALKFIAELPEHMKNAFATLGFNPKNDAVDWDDLR